MFLGSKTQTWEGGIREPGIVWWPGVVAPQVRHEVASTLDVFATVADAVGAVLPAGRVYDSVSLLPLLTGATITLAEHLFARLVAVTSVAVELLVQNTWKRRCILPLTIKKLTAN